jgi:hypothetical protein
MGAEQPLSIAEVLALSPEAQRKAEEQFLEEKRRRDQELEDAKKRRAFEEKLPQTIAQAVQEAVKGTAPLTFHVDKQVNQETGIDWVAETAVGMFNRLAERRVAPHPALRPSWGPHAPTGAALA